MNPEESLIGNAINRLEMSYLLYGELVSESPLGEDQRQELMEDAERIKVSAVERLTLDAVEQAYIDIEEMMVMLDESR